MPVVHRLCTSTHFSSPCSPQLTSTFSPLVDERTKQVEHSEDYEPRYERAAECREEGDQYAGQGYLLYNFQSTERPDFGAYSPPQYGALSPGHLSGHGPQHQQPARSASRAEASQEAEEQLAYYGKSQSGASHVSNSRAAVYSIAPNASQQVENASLSRRRSDDRIDGKFDFDATSGGRQATVSHGASQQLGSCGDRPDGGPETGYPAGAFFPPALAHQASVSGGRGAAPSYEQHRRSHNQQQQQLFLLKHGPSAAFLRPRPGALDPYTLEAHSPSGHGHLHSTASFAT